MSESIEPTEGVNAASVESVVHRLMSSWEKRSIANEDWIRQRWGGFTHLVIGRNEDFMLDFKDGSLWLHYENDSRYSPVGRVMLLEKPTRQGIVDVERLFGCK